jgi:hypothetical protein
MMVVDALLGLGGKLIDKLIPDPAARDAARLELLKLQQSGELAAMLAQTEINKVEAANASVFVSGARPFILWGCGAALLYAALFEPFMRFIAVVVFHYTGAFPVIDTTLTTQVLIGLLGLGGLRSYDKLNGVASR